MTEASPQWSLNTQDVPEAVRMAEGWQELRVRLEQTITALREERDEAQADWERVQRGYDAESTALEHAKSRITALEQERDELRQAKSDAESADRAIRVDLQAQLATAQAALREIADTDTSGWKGTIGPLETVGMHNAANWFKNKARAALDALTPATEAANG